MIRSHLAKKLQWKHFSAYTAVLSTDSHTTKYTHSRTVQLDKEENFFVLGNSITSTCPRKQWHIKIAVFVVLFLMMTLYYIIKMRAKNIGANNSPFFLTFIKMKFVLERCRSILIKQTYFCRKSILYLFLTEKNQFDRKETWESRLYKPFFFYFILYYMHNKLTETTECNQIFNKHSKQPHLNQVKLKTHKKSHKQQ